METALSLAALGVSALTSLFIFGYWKGQIDTKITTLWDVYVTSVLTRDIQREQIHNPGLPHSWDSPLEKIRYKRSHPGKTGLQIIKDIGVPEIDRVARDNGESFGEVLAQALIQVMKK